MAGSHIDDQLLLRVPEVRFWNTDASIVCAASLVSKVDQRAVLLQLWKQTE